MIFCAEQTITTDAPILTDASSSSSPSMIPIVAGAVGGGVLFCGILVAFLLLRKRMQRNNGVYHSDQLRSSNPNVILSSQGTQFHSMIGFYL